MRDEKWSMLDGIMAMNARRKADTSILTYLGTKNEREAMDLLWPDDDQS